MGGAVDREEVDARKVSRSEAARLAVGVEDHSGGKVGSQARGGNATLRTVIGVVKV